MGLRGFPEKAEQLDAKNIPPCQAIARICWDNRNGAGFLRDSDWQQQSGSSHSTSKEMSQMQLQRCPWAPTLRGRIDEYGVGEREGSWQSDISGCSLR